MAADLISFFIFSRMNVDSTNENRGCQRVRRFVLFPHKKVVSAVDRIIKYLYDTKGQSLNFIREPRPNCVRVFTDSSHASEYDRMSRHGYLVFYGRNLIGYASKKSSLICKSSSAAELDALNMGEEAGSMYGIKLENVTGRKMAITYFIDSQTVLNWMEQEYWKGNRFLGVKIEYLKIELRMKNIKIHKIKGTVNPADILTKPVTRTQFETLVRIMEAGYTTFTYLSEPFLIRSSLMRITEISLFNSGSLPSVQHRTYRLVYRSGSPDPGCHLLRCFAWFSRGYPIRYKGVHRADGRGYCDLVF